MAILTNKERFKLYRPKYPEICERIEAIYLNSGLTLIELATLLGLKENTLKQIIYRHITPTITVLRKLHRQFGVSYDYLMAEKGAEKLDLKISMMSTGLEKNISNGVIKPVEKRAGRKRKNAKKK